MDEKKLNQLLGQMVNDMGAAAVAPLVIVGDKLGLYRTLAESNRLSAKQLAAQTKTDERYVEEWCAAQAASGYISFDKDEQTFYMTDEQAAVFADSDSPTCMTGGFYGIRSMFVDEPMISEAFKTGAGVGWDEHDACLFCGTEKFFRPGYQANLVENWLPSLEGVLDKLKRGGKVADVGCGHGASTIVMAQAFPNSEFIGFDFHQESIDCANQRARESGVNNVKFKVASAKQFSGKDYDLIAFFDCLHDMGDPIGAAEHSRNALADGGTMMVVEPFAHDKLEDNLNPIGRMFYSFSTMICTPASRSQEVGLALGAQAGEKRLTDVMRQGGFRSVRRATETPFNLILEARA